MRPSSKGRPRRAAQCIAATRLVSGTGTTTSTCSVRTQRGKTQYKQPRGERNKCVPCCHNSIAAVNHTKRAYNVRKACLCHVSNTHQNLPDLYAASSLVKNRRRPHKSQGMQASAYLGEKHTSSNANSAYATTCTSDRRTRRHKPHLSQGNLAGYFFRQPQAHRHARPVDLRRQRHENILWAKSKPMFGCGPRRIFGGAIPVEASYENGVDDMTTDLHSAPRQYTLPNTRNGLT